MTRAAFASTPEVVVVGAGLAGLACTRTLVDHGRSVVCLEAADAPGGRVRTDRLDGFLLDRGFQVLLTAYPEARERLDYEALDLHAFEPGAIVRTGRRFVRVSDPIRRPRQALATLAARVGSPLDKARILRLRWRVSRGSLVDLFERPETTTIAALHQEGFSEAMIDRFLRPLFGGVLLDPSLRTSSRMFEFVFRMFAAGDVALPAAGMGAIPAQLSRGLDVAGVLRLACPVESLGPGDVRLADGGRLQPRAVVVATDGQQASRFVSTLHSPRCRSAITLYYATDVPPVDEPALVLDGDDSGPVNHLCVPSAVAPGYAPPGAALVSVSVVDDHGLPPDVLDSVVRDQLGGWFGLRVKHWQHLRTYRIAHAQPDQTPPALARPQRPVRMRPGLYVCGDHRDTASINGALASGRRAAEAVLADT